MALLFMHIDINLKHCKIFFCRFPAHQDYLLLWYPCIEHMKRPSYTEIWSCEGHWSATNNCDSFLRNKSTTKSTESGISQVTRYTARKFHLKSKFCLLVFWNFQRIIISMHICIYLWVIFSRLSGRDVPGMELAVSINILINFVLSLIRDRILINIF